MEMNNEIVLMKNLSLFATFLNFFFALNLEALLLNLPLQNKASKIECSFLSQILVSGPLMNILQIMATTTSRKQRKEIR
jgi:hypothetical protein